jgi:hypothetical protein
MFDSPVLNVVIGLIFVYLLYSLFATIVQEMIASFFSLRAKTLSNAIERMLEDGGSNTTIWTDILNWAKSVAQSFWHRLAPVKETPPETLADLFFSNPGIKYLADGKKNSKPSYLEPTVFSKALIDVLKGDTNPTGNTVAQIKNNLSTDKFTAKVKGVDTVITIQPDTKTYLLSLINDSNNDIDKFKASLEQWFNNMMDRASGWYKRQGQRILLVIGLCIAVSFNVDTIGIAGSLSDDPKAADRMATMAAAFVKDPESAKLVNAVGNKQDTNSPAYKELQEFYKTNQADIAKANQVLGLGWNLVKQHKKVNLKIDAECPKKYDKILFAYRIYVQDSGKLSDSLDQKKDTIVWKKKNRTKSDSIRIVNEIRANANDLRQSVSGITRLSFISITIDTVGKHNGPIYIAGNRHYTTCEKLCFISGNIWHNPKSILGFLITAIAISLGAPFWFDLLSKVVNLRNAGAKPDDSPTPTSGAGSNNTPAVSPTDRVA